MVCTEKRFLGIYSKLLTMVTPGIEVVIVKGENFQSIKITPYNLDSKGKGFEQLGLGPTYPECSTNVC